MRNAVTTRIALALAAALLLAGCAVRQTPIHPGALNAFDSGAYDSLIVAQSALTQAKAHIADFPALKPALNKAIASYNEALAAYKLYHVSGTGDTLALDHMIGELVAQTAALLGQMGVKP